MGYRKRNRQCGCDCRDAGTYEDAGEVFNPLGCTACGGDKPPCHYILHFPCTVRNGSTDLFSGDVTLMPICPFQDSCIYSEPDVDEFDPNQCTSTQGKTAPLTKKWSMDLEASPVQATYTDTGISIVYEASGAWDCFNENTVDLVSATSGITGLPNRLCITPDMTNGCNSTCNGGGCQENDYDTEMNRIACCDPNCDDTSFSGRIFLKKYDGTGTTTEISRSLHGTSTGVTGLNSPSGPSYGVTRDNADISLPFGDGVRAVMYCSEGTWYCDWYHAPSATPTVYTLQETTTFTSTCCPLDGCTGPILMSLSSGDYLVCATIGTATACFDCGPMPCAGECKYVAALDTSVVTSGGGIAGTTSVTLSTTGTYFLEINGGGGGGGASSAASSVAGQGGGAGGYSAITFSGTAGDVLTFVVGAGGSGGFTLFARDGANGSSTTASSAGGAFSTLTAGGGNGGAGDPTSGATGVGGTGTTLNGLPGTTPSGTTGGTGGNCAFPQPGGGAGGSGGTSGAAGNAATGSGCGGGGGGLHAAGGAGKAGWWRLTRPTYKWIYNSDTCVGTCDLPCPTVDSTFTSLHGTPVTSSDTLFVDCE